MSQARLTAEAAAAATGGLLLQTGAGQGFHGVSIDSRAVEPGQAFVAISGERFDGHRFLPAAMTAGASLLVISRDLEQPAPAETAVLRVDDTRRALGMLGQAWLQQISPTVLAITGSVGKTTTKELLRGIMELTGPTHATPGNFNNDIGLPLTLLGMPAGTRNLVLEMGMNHPGEIAGLAKLVRPAVGLITAVAPVHLEGLGSMEAIAAAKAELIMELAPGGTAVIPGDEPLLHGWAARLDPASLLTFGQGPGDRVRLLAREAVGRDGSRIFLSLDGQKVEVLLKLVGRHNASNAAAAAGAALAAGVPASTIAEGLAKPLRLDHRSSLRTLGPFTVLDDCYNASPVAMGAALDALSELAGATPRAAVLGAMLELGDEEARYHREVGSHAAAAGLDLLVTVGALGADIARGAGEAGFPAAKMIEAETPEGAARALEQRFPGGGWVLVKASHGAHLERTIEALSKIYETEATG